MSNQNFENLSISKSEDFDFATKNQYYQPSFAKSPTISTYSNATNLDDLFYVISHHHFP